MLCEPSENPVISEVEKVLILVLMEYALREIVYPYQQINITMS